MNLRRFSMALAILLFVHNHAMNAIIKDRRGFDSLGCVAAHGSLDTDAWYWSGCLVVLSIRCWFLWKKRSVESCHQVTKGRDFDTATSQSGKFFRAGRRGPAS